MKKKQILLFLLLILFSPVGAGCASFGYSEVTQIAMVQAVAIDIDEQDNFHLTFQIFNATGGGGQVAIDPAEQNTKMLSSEGRTLAEAVCAAEIDEGKKIFFGQNKVIVIGEETARKKINRVLSYFNTALNSRPDVYMVVARGAKGEEIIKRDINFGIIPAQVVELAVSRSVALGYSNDMKLFELIKNLNNQYGHFTLAVIEKDETQQQNNTGQGEGGGSGGSDSSGGEQQDGENINAITVEGSAVFTNGEMKGYLNQSETRGLSWIQNTIEETQIVTDIEKADIMTVHAYDNRSKVTIDVTDLDQIEVLADIRTSCEVEEVIMKESAKTQSLGPEDFDETKRAVENEIRAACTAAVEKAIYEYQCNIFNFENVSVKGSAANWQKLKQHFSDYTDRLQIAFQIHVNVSGTGLEGRLN